MKNITSFGLLLIATFALILGIILYKLTNQVETIQVEQVIDCWEGEQIATPHVQFKTQFQKDGKYCLVIPKD